MRSPSIGKVMNRILEINPDLGVEEMRQIIRQAMSTLADARGKAATGEFAQAEVIDEEKAVALARATLSSK